MGGNCHAEAARILEQCWQKWPDEQRFGVKLLDCQLSMQHVPETRATFERIVAAKQKYAAEAQIELDKFLAELRNDAAENSTPAKRHRLRQLRRRAGTNQPALAFLEASVLRAEGRYREALVQLESALETQAHHRPSVLRNMGEIHLELQQWEEADCRFRQALELDPEDAQAHVGLCLSLLSRGRNRSAAKAARASIGLCFHNPRAHYLMGVALERCRRTRLAIDALETAVRQNPNFAEAHRRLAFLYGQQLFEPELAILHQRQALDAERIFRQSSEPTTEQAATLCVGIPPAGKNTWASAAKAPWPPSEVITIVSGLPRSGTSMMMQMLQAGGIPVLTDEHRQPDDSNPHGYFEYEKVKSLARANTWLADSKGKALKVIAQLMPFLPSGPYYKIIFMDRDVREVLASQHRMLEHLGRSGTAASDDSLADIFAKQCVRAKKFAHQCLGAQILTIGYCETMKNAGATARQIAGFLERDDLNIEAMAAAVDPRLCHPRVTATGGECS
jgi:tetratricopeptide (TPR) repeat protein